jgi:DNA-binding transcriptional ArsR family regulator
MSRDARDWAWAQDTSPTQKLVLLALAEHANDGYACWPSIHRLQERTGLSRRGVQKALRELEQRGLVSAERGGGRSANRYALNLPGVQEVRATYACDAPQPRTPCTSTAHPVHPNRNRTEIEPSLNPKRVRVRAKEVTVPDWMDRSLWQQFLEHRRFIKAPMTEVAKRRAITTLAKLRDEGHEPEAVLNQSIVNGWKGVFPVKQHSGSESRRFSATVEALQSLFGEDDGSQDISAGDGLPGGRLRHGAV